MSDRLLTPEEIQIRLDEYWDLYWPSWEDGTLDETDYERGIDYWTLEAQRDLTASLVAQEIKEGLEKELELNETLDENISMARIMLIREIRMWWQSFWDKVLGG